MRDLAWSLSVPPPRSATQSSYEYLSSTRCQKPSKQISSSVLRVRTSNKLGSSSRESSEISTVILCHINATLGLPKRHVSRFSRRRRNEFVMVPRSYQK